MKLIIAITRDEDSDSIIETLIEKEYKLTRIASTGGFLRRGMTTMMIGVEDEKVDDVIKIMKDKCAPVSERTRSTILFVLNIDRFAKI